MITVYEIKPNGMLGSSKQIDPVEGVGVNWTYAAPPGEGSYRWEAGEWVPAPPPFFEGVIGGVPPVSSAANQAEAKQRLAETDWVNQPDVYDPTLTARTLLNRAEFLTYRAQLRAIAIDPPEGNIEWPTKPSSIWSE